MWQIKWQKLILLLIFNKFWEIPLYKTKKLLYFTKSKKKEGIYVKN